MIPWSTLNPLVLSILARIGVGDGFEVEHADRPRKMVSVQHKRTITLKVLTVVGLGDDEERREQIADDATGADAKWAGKLRVTSVGHRRVTYQLTCDALENTDQAWAWDTIERIRTRLLRTSTREQLNAINAAVIRNRIGAGVEANFKLDNRIVSRVVMDFALNVWISDVETDPTGWIEFAVVTSEPSDLDGTLLPDALRVINEQIPAS